MSFSTAEQYPKLVNGPPPERRRVGKDKKQICDKRERKLGRESSRKQLQTSQNIFFFTHLMRRWRFLFEADRRKKSLKRK